MLYIPTNKAGCWSKRCLMFFYHIWTWQPFGPCDPTHFLSAHKLSYTCTKFVKYSQLLLSYVSITNWDVQTVGQRYICQKKSMVSLFRGRKGCLSGGVGGWGVWEGVWQQMVQIWYIIWKFCSNKVTALPFMNARILWMSSLYSIKHVQVIRIFNFLTDYYFNIWSHYILRCPVIC